MRGIPAVFLVLLTVTGCDMAQGISEGAYRNAVSDGVEDELKGQGIELQDRPLCTTQQGGGDSVVRVRCTALTRTSEPVTVHGVAYEAHTVRPRESYVVTVAGREVLRKDCLSQGCGRR
ncbi:hypothetical protein E1264_24660 [Actinomadura sp. KC216]|uniref:hypothetical protein n=1 Tax=Actinomadura sp. KC216 TaxID=2530370 RepID=UPI001048AEC7|nr:hypothetical protein [Actinomadura sp. KC216]TDB84418.1 hypothetical protein E1264_24660 [Actinomadura sp. KC216]